MPFEDLAVVLFRMCLAGVFALAGTAKLRDIEGSKQALADFGVPAGAAGVLGVALPIAELGVATALFAAPTVPYGAAAALALLLIFTVAIARNVARGHTKSCQCFGQWSSTPVGPRLLVRNLVLATMAAAVLVTHWVTPAPSLVGWISALSLFERAVVVGGAVGLALLTAQIVLLLRLTRLSQRETMSVDVESARPLPVTTVGQPAPAFSLPSLEGTTTTLDTLLAAGRPVLLAFADPDCQPCEVLLPKLARWQREHRRVTTIAVVTRGAETAVRAKFSVHTLTHVLRQRDREVSRAYGVRGTPAAVLVMPDGTIGSPVAKGEDGIGALIDRAQSLVPAEAPPIDFELPDLDGTLTRLSSLRSGPTVLLLWNPSCGFCTRIVDDVRAWELRPASDRLPLVVVSSGDRDATRQNGFASPVLLSEGFGLGRTLGARGTPAAMIIGIDGRPIGPPVNGGPAVLELLGIGDGSDLSLQSRPLKNPDVEDELLPDAGMVLYNRATAKVLTLNATAAFVWESCDGQRTVASLVEEVRELFPAAATEIEADIRRLLDRLLRNRMISLDVPAQEPA
jgi:peroxiredoxin/uncharacterized membrane protein YphA (DoxX/SURF4 family)